MPPIGSNVIDTQGVAVVTAWINSLADFQTLAEWNVAHWGATNHPDADPGADPDLDGGDNRYERLTRTSPTNQLDVYTIADISSSNSTVFLEYEELADVGYAWESAHDLPGGDWTHLEAPGHRVRYPAADGPAGLQAPSGAGASFRLKLHEL